ncbi:carcinoembryonic antigen-related cell adhesion molecule 1 isoform X2 [Lates calcarifer]|uniref:Carcinoembryonic antigen-related cell adhesion molecule 1 isoform X2 n=1 Tax=Lates calcarifer TaxID=8187 RepID=A0AAJ8BI48_LATCA|nr:carcinoembryonic antigen-related cell adhesion molecule 1 isoform X2 [Lates calcarifer]
MDVLFLLYVVSATFAGLSEGAGVLPADSLNAAVGRTVTFTTTLTPQENQFVAWTFDFNNIITTNTTSETTAPQYEGRITLDRFTGSLQLRNVSLTDSGEYRVSIISPGGGFYTGQTRLDVYVPVSNVRVTANSSDLIEFNSSVSLSCSSSGSSLSFLWLNSSSEVTASDRVQLTDGGAILTIISVTRYDQGPFRCRVFNPVSNGSSDPVNLSISYGPDNITLTLSPSQEYYVEGSNIILSCSAVSRPSSLFYWFLNGDLLTARGSELRLMNIQMSQSGNYSCQAFNNKTMRTQISQPSVVSVLERISGASVKSSTNQPVDGNSVNLTCEAAGSVFTRQWMKDGSDLILTDNMMLYNEGRVLSFQPLKKKDSGEYSCKISNPVSSDEAKYVMVVNYGPENVKITGETLIYLQETLKLTCSAESTPSASYTWMWNKTEIISYSAELTKVITELSESGNYTCQAMNNVTRRTLSAVHELTVKAERPPSCSAGCIAGIVIACLVVVGAAAGGGYYIYKNKKMTKKSNRDTDTRTGGGGQNNAGFSGSQELNYADIRFFQNSNGGAVQLGPQSNPSEYAQVQVNSGSPAVSSLPTYEVHMQRMQIPAAQSGTQTYSQVRRN